MVCYMHVFAVLAVLMRYSNAQPIQCKEDAHCPSGFYCEDDTLFCRECLLCEDLKREPPVLPTSCVKSVIECGSCFKNLSEDQRGDVSSKCVTPTPGTGSRATTPAPVYLWIAAVVGLCLILLILGGVVLYVLRYTDTFKILASTRTSVLPTCTTDGVAAYPSPPPYNTMWFAPQGDVTPVLLPVDSPDSTRQMDVSQSAERLPFVKCASEDVWVRARESRDSQAARVFNNPVYVRGPEHPVNEFSAQLEEPEQNKPITPHDEDTMESTWTPVHISSEDDNANSQVEDQEALVPRNYFEPPRKVICVRQDTNNNREDQPDDNADSSQKRASQEAHSTFVHSGPSFIINVVKNVNTLQQCNDVIL